MLPEPYCLDQQAAEYLAGLKCRTCSGRGVVDCSGIDIIEDCPDCRDANGHPTGRRFPGAWKECPCLEYIRKGETNWFKCLPCADCEDVQLDHSKSACETWCEGKGRVVRSIPEVVLAVMENFFNSDFDLHIGNVSFNNRWDVAIWKDWASINRQYFTGHGDTIIQALAAAVRASDAHLS